MTTLDNNESHVLNDTELIDSESIKSNINTLNTEISAADETNKNEEEEEENAEGQMMATSSSSSPNTDSKQRKKRKSKDTDFEPPAASINKLVKSILPSKLQITKDARSAFQRASGIFIFYLTHAANDIARLNKRSTILPKDVIAALKELEYSEFVAPVEKVCEEFRESLAAAKARATASASSSNDDRNGNAHENDTDMITNEDENKSQEEVSVGSDADGDEEVDVDEVESVDDDIEAEQNRDNNKDRIPDDISVIFENEEDALPISVPATESDET